MEERRTEITPAGRQKPVSSSARMTSQEQPFGSETAASCHSRLGQSIHVQPASPHRWFGPSADSTGGAEQGCSAGLMYRYIELRALAARGESRAWHRDRQGARFARRDEGEYWALFDREATPRGGMPRRSNAAGLSPRAARSVRGSRSPAHPREGPRPVQSATRRAARHRRRRVSSARSWHGAHGRHGGQPDDR